MCQMHELGPCEQLGVTRKVAFHFVHGARMLQKLLPGQVQLLDWSDPKVILKQQ